MSYYRRYSRARPELVPATPELGARIEQVAGELYAHLTDWEKGFVESISDAYKKWSGLTTGQFSTFEKIEGKYTPEALELKSNWLETFDDEKRKTLNLVVDYYRTTSYFSNLIAKIDSDTNYVPDENTWKKLVENKYAKKVVKAQTTDSQFGGGGFALLRDTFRPRGPGFWGKAQLAGRSITDRKGRPVLVLKRSDRKSTDKVWWVAFIDNPTAMWELEERWLKKYRRVKKQIPLTIG